MQYQSVFESPDENKITLNLNEKQQKIVDCVHNVTRIALCTLADDPTVKFSERFIEEAATQLANMMLAAGIPAHYPAIICDDEGNDLYVEEWLGKTPNGTQLS